MLPKMLPAPMTRQQYGYSVSLPYLMSLRNKPRGLRATGPAIPGRDAGANRMDWGKGVGAAMMVMVRCPDCGSEDVRRFSGRCTLLEWRGIPHWLCRNCVLLFEACDETEPPRMELAAQ